MSSDPLVLAKEVLDFLAAHEVEMDKRNTTITGLVAHVEKSKRLVSILEQQRQVPFMAPLTWERVAPETRVRSVTVTLAMDV